MHLELVVVLIQFVTYDLLHYVGRCWHLVLCDEFPIEFVDYAQIVGISDDRSVLWRPSEEQVHVKSQKIQQSKSQESKRPSLKSHRFGLQVTSIS